eukprot:3428457-Pyramimonas_sp.AAC.1
MADLAGNLLVVDATSGAPLSSFPRWLIRCLLVGVVRPCRGSTGTFCHGGWGGVVSLRPQWESLG